MPRSGEYRRPTWRTSTSEIHAARGVECVGLRVVYTRKKLWPRQACRKPMCCVKKYFRLAYSSSRFCLQSWKSCFFSVLIFRKFHYFEGVFSLSNEITPPPLSQQRKSFLPKPFFAFYVVKRMRTDSTVIFFSVFLKTDFHEVTGKSLVDAFSHTNSK